MMASAVLSVETTIPALCPKSDLSVKHRVHPRVRFYTESIGDWGKASEEELNQKAENCRLNR